MRNKIFLAALPLALAPFIAGFRACHLGCSPKLIPRPTPIICAHFRVGHGCNGSPTTALSIAFPISVSDVRPEAKPGWKISQSTKGPGVTITWRGGRIPADKPDEFTVALRLPMKPGRVAFPATQTCEKGEEVWSELPADDGHHLDHPVPLLNVGATPADSMAGMGGMASAAANKLLVHEPQRWLDPPLARRASGRRGISTLKN